MSCPSVCLSSATYVLWRNGAKSTFCALLLNLLFIRVKKTTIRSYLKSYSSSPVSRRPLCDWDPWYHSRKRWTTNCHWNRHLKVERLSVEPTTVAIGHFQNNRPTYSKEVNGLNATCSLGVCAVTLNRMGLYTRSRTYECFAWQCSASEAWWKSNGTAMYIGRQTASYCDILRVRYTTWWNTWQHTTGTKRCLFFNESGNKIRKKDIVWATYMNATLTSGQWASV